MLCCLQVNLSQAWAIIAALLIIIMPVLNEFWDIRNTIADRGRVSIETAPVALSPVTDATVASPEKLEVAEMKTGSADAGITPPGGVATDTAPP